MVEFISTTNEQFQYMQGKKIDATDFAIGVIIWFDTFHTSALQLLEYKYGDDYVDVKATTCNSVYVFRIWDDA